MRYNQSLMNYSSVIEGSISGWTTKKNNSKLLNVFIYYKGHNYNKTLLLMPFKFVIKEVYNLPNILK